MAMNGRANCILEICCKRADAEAALAEQIEEDLKCDKAESKKHAKWIHDNFDLAPKGTLVELKASIAKLALEQS